jgi:hypothetical protein
MAGTTQVSVTALHPLLRITGTATAKERWQKGLDLFALLHALADELKRHTFLSKQRDIRP